MLRLAIVCTHPIQYFAPVFSQLASRADLTVRVFYGWRGATEQAMDPGFGQKISWDIPLLEGYDYEFVENVAQDPGSHHFRGIDLPDLNQTLERWKPDAILIYGWCYKSHLKTMRHFHGRIPVLFRGDSTLLNESSGWRRWARRVALRWVYRYVDLALYVGTNSRKYFEAHGLRTDQLVFAPHSVDNRRFASLRHDDHQNSMTRIDVRKQLSIPHDHVLFMFVGKLEPIKNPLLLVQAFAQLDQPQTHLVFVGSGPLQQSLVEQLVPRVHFLGFQNQQALPDMYAAADLIILPSKSETWGLVLNEAMACGCAVMASDRVGAAVDLIEENHNGWICKVNDLASLIDCLKAAASKGRDGLAEMGFRSRQIIDDWTNERQVDAIAAAVAQVATIRRKRLTVDSQS